MKRRIGLTSAAALVVANMIGAGIFTVPGLALEGLGGPLPVLTAWLAGGVLALCGALSYGALARVIPESGGEYTFLSRTAHPLVGFLAGWVSLWAGFTAPIAAAALGLQAYLSPWLDTHVRPEWLGTAAIAAAGAMHGFRFRLGIAMQNVVVAVKLAAISAFLALGLFLLPQRAVPVATVSGEVSVAVFAVTVLWVSFAYSGWNAAVYVAGEVRDPVRNLPRALCWATSVVTILYLALNVVFLSSAPREELAGRVNVAAVAAEAIGGPGLRNFVSILVALALFTSISSMVMAGPRIYARMAAEGVMPKFFERAGDTPGTAVLLQVALAIFVMWAADLMALLSYMGIALGLSSAATVTGLVWLRRNAGARRVPVPGYPWVPAIFVLGTLSASALAVVENPLETGLGLLTVLAGLPIYGLMRRAVGSCPSTRSIGGQLPTDCETIP